MGRKSTQKSTSTKKPPIPAGSKLPNPLVETAWRVAVPFLLFSISGIWLDRLLDTDPMFSVIGIILALVAVKLVIYRYVKDNYPETFKKDDQ